MEGKIKALDRKLLIKATKTVLYFIPIVGLTNGIYLKIYGKYEMDFSGFVHFAETNMVNLVVAFLIFSALFLLFYFLEQYLIPLMLIATNKGKYDLNDDEKEKIGDGYTKTYGINFLKLSDEPFFRFELVSDIAFFFIVPILWLSYWNHWVGYVIIALLTFVFFILAKGMIIMFEPGKDSTKIPKDE